MYTWQGTLQGIQPHVRLFRVYDVPTWDEYIGFVLLMSGWFAGEAEDYRIGVRRLTLTKHDLRVGDELAARSAPPDPTEHDIVDGLGARQLKVLKRGPRRPSSPPPWRGVPPALKVYIERGFRRLSATTYRSKCTSCIWGCEMAVETRACSWGVQQPQFRREAFCYGPKSCSLYQAGPERRIEGIDGRVYIEGDAEDEERTSDRGWDE
jgi:hypothetical protein